MTTWTLRLFVKVLIGMTVVGLAATACSSSTSSGAGGLNIHSTAVTPAGSSKPVASGPASSDAGTVVGDVCKLVPLDVVEKQFGGPAEAKSTQVACVFISKADQSRTIELLKEPAGVLSTQLAEGDFVSMEGLGTKAYWDESDELLVVVHGGDDYAVSASVADDGDPANKVAAVSVAKAAIDD